MSFWSFLPSIVTAGATLYGASQATKSSDRAADQALEATREASRVSEANLNANRSAASPGLLRTQEIINRGSKLTPEQQQAVDDSRRQSINALKGSSLRGSARATSAVVSDTDNRIRNNFMQSNRNTSDGAALGLAGQYFNANTSSANSLSNNLINQGNIEASNTLGQGALRGGAIGDVGAVISDTLKNDVIKKRDSSYDTIEELPLNG